jgi:hypothetical protein
MSHPRRPQRRSSSKVIGPAIALAALALVGVMGVTVLSSRTEVRRTAPAPTPELRAPQQAGFTAHVRPMIAAPQLSHMDRLEGILKEVERKMPSLRKATRGKDFEPLRVGLLAQVSEARGQLADYMDAHPGDDRANRLWDRAMRTYVALKKL